MIDYSINVILYIETKCNFGVSTSIGKHSLERLCFFMFKKILQRIHDTKKWKLYLFYDGILIKKIKLRNEDFQNKPIYITIVGHKDKFGKFIVGRMVVPVRLLKTDENKKITYWGVIDEIGVEVE